MPPRVNVNIGTTSSTAPKTKTGRKRPREDVEVQMEEVVLGTGANAVEEDVEVPVRRRDGKERRIETLGQKKVDKEIYKKGKDRQKAAAGGSQWSR